MKRVVTGGWLSRFAATSILLMASGGLFANNSKISPDLQPLLAKPSGTVNVIVQYSAPQKCRGCSASSFARWSTFWAAW